MAQFREAIHRDTVLLVGPPLDETFAALKDYATQYEKTLRLLVITNRRSTALYKRVLGCQKQHKFELIVCDFSSPVKIKQVLEPHKDRLLAITCQTETAIKDFRKVIPHVPYLNTPTSDSLDWSTDKIKMRELLQAHNPKMSPRHMVVADSTPQTIAKIEKNVGFPLVIKPAGMAASLLVSICYHEDELEINLRKTLRKLYKIDKERDGNGSPKILVEQFMEGAMYSVDAYVNLRGNVYTTPPVIVKTGREIGFDDFFGYQQITPTTLLKQNVDAANDVVLQSVKALGLRSTTCHVELMRTEEGWKIIELAPRLGGFRTAMYGNSFGISHVLNDILIRIPQKPLIPKKRKGYTAFMKIFAKTEGKLVSIKGVNRVRKLASYKQIIVNRAIGDDLLFAKNGGAHVVRMYLFNENRSKLLADIRRMESYIQIEVEPKRRRKTSQVEQAGEIILHTIEEGEELTKKIAQKVTRKVKEQVKETLG